MRLEDAYGMFLKFQELGLIDPSLSLDALIAKKEGGKFTGTSVESAKIEVKVRYFLANAVMTENGPVAFFPYDVYKKGK